MQNTIDQMKEAAYQLSLLYRDYSDFVEVVDGIIDNAEKIIILPKSYVANTDISPLINKKGYKTIEFFDDYVNDTRYIELQGLNLSVTSYSIVLNHVSAKKDSYIILVGETDFDVFFKKYFYQAVYLVDVELSSLNEVSRSQRLQNLMNGGKMSRNDYENCEHELMSLEVAHLIQNLESVNLEQFMQNKIDELLAKRDFVQLEKLHSYIK